MTPDLLAQLRETETTLLEHLAEDPESVIALCVGGLVVEIYPDPDPRLVKACARPRDPGFARRARAASADLLLHRLWTGFRRQGLDEIFRRRLDEIAGPCVIDASFVPAGLSGKYHASGHLARVAVKRGERNHGFLALDEEPGSGRFYHLGYANGSGFIIDERYQGGMVLTTLNTPWHDGTESREQIHWTIWVRQCLSSLAEAAQEPKPRRKAEQRGKRKKRR